MRSKEGEKGRFGMGDFFSSTGAALAGDSGLESSPPGGAA